MEKITRPVIRKDMSVTEIAVGESETVLQIQGEDRMPEDGMLALSNGLYSNIETYEVRLKFMAAKFEFKKGKTFVVKIGIFLEKELLTDDGMDKAYHFVMQNGLFFGSYATRDLQRIIR